MEDDSSAKTHLTSAYCAGQCLNSRARLVSTIQNKAPHEISDSIYLHLRISCLQLECALRSTDVSLAETRAGALQQSWLFLVGTITTAPPPRPARAFLKHRSCGFYFVYMTICFAVGAYAVSWHIPVVVALVCYYCLPWLGALTVVSRSSMCASSHRI